MEFHLSGVTLSNLFSAEHGLPQSNMQSYLFPIFRFNRALRQHLFAVSSILSVIELSRLPCLHQLKVIHSYTLIIFKYY